jgi:hypothetical protein
VPRRCIPCVPKSAARSMVGMLTSSPPDLARPAAYESLFYISVVGWIFLLTFFLVPHRPLADPPCMKRFSRLTPTYALPSSCFFPGGRWLRTKASIGNWVGFFR